MEDVGVVINPDFYSSNLRVVGQAYVELQALCSSNCYVNAELSPLITKFENSLTEFATTEATITLRSLKLVIEGLQTIRQIANDADSYYAFVSKTANARLTLTNASNGLASAAKAHTSNLTNLKRLEDDARKAEQALQARGSAMKQKGKDRKAQAAAAGIFGILLAPVTMGVSLGVGALAAGGLYENGETLLVKYRELRGKSSQAVVHFSKSLDMSVRFIDQIAAIVNEISSEVGSVGKGDTKAQILRSAKKAAKLEPALSGYLGIIEEIFG